MTIGINTGFDIGRKGLRAALVGLNTAGNNIVNVNTEGYSRRRVQLKESAPLVTHQGVFGTGVEVAQIIRIRDRLLDKQFRTIQPTRVYAERQESIHRQIETIFNEPVERGGIRQLMSNFFDVYSDLANEPESDATRALVRESAITLTETFRRVDQQLTILSEDLRFEIEQKMLQLNAISAAIAGLNSKIGSQEGIGGNANELRDERDRLLDSLSELSDVFFIEDNNKAINVSLGGRAVVTSGTALADFENISFLEGRDLHSKIVDKETGTELKPNSGDLRAMLDGRNVVIPRFRELLDKLTKSLIDNVNAIHVNGVGLKGNLLEVPKDNVFFTGDNSGNFNISDAIKDNLNNIATAERVETLRSDGTIRVTSAPGNNKVALEMSNLKRNRLLENQTSTFDEFLARIIGTLGAATSRFSDEAVANNRLQNEFQNLRDSTSGVSIDEEVTLLIQFQRSFQASARVISTLDEMFETLINL